MTKPTKEMIKESFIRHLRLTLAKREKKASKLDCYQALALSIRDLMVDKFLATRDSYEDASPRTVNYISLEYLMGRTMGNAMINLEVFDVAKEAMAELGFDVEELRETETDAGLGNGGLGRLAACFLDSMATLELPCYGYGIRYDYGIFRQVIQNGYQTEEPDNWLSSGNPWEIRRPELARTVCFGGRVESFGSSAGNSVRKRWVDTAEVTAMPYDTPIPGYGVNTVNTLRLWSAESPCGFNLAKFNQGDYINANLEMALSGNITRILYPNDNNYEGKELRLKQQYFLVSATLQDIFARLRAQGRSPEEIPELETIQLNDTHPALAIPELMRLLVDEEGYSWEKAQKICTRTFNYTNHTLMSEALEKWSVDLLGKLLPRHLEIIYELNFRFLREVSTKFMGDGERIARMSLIEEGAVKQVRMAYMCVAASQKVNGVAALHTELLKNGLFRDFYDFSPEKFINVTNGITPRRWLKKANVDLSSLITEAIGDKWVKDLDELQALEKFRNDGNFLSELARVKRENKVRLRNTLMEECDFAPDPDSLFDVQVKRLHEYKRQFLNVLHGISLYLDLKEKGVEDFVPRTILFGAKAAPGYYLAKLIIKFISNVSYVLNSDPQTRDCLKMCFVPNYRVSLAERIIPAADLSEQISLAGTEASGTGNMKFALNGALTIGSLDGANVEIREAVGEENIFIFGLRVPEVTALKSAGYDPARYIGENPRLRRILDLIASDFFSTGEKGIFQPLLDSLKVDPYMVCADFQSYCETQKLAAFQYRDTALWQEKCLLNIARMGNFSSDRSIKDYAEKIWHVEKVPVILRKGNK